MKESFRELLKGKLSERYSPRKIGQRDTLVKPQVRPVSKLGTKLAFLNLWNDWNGSNVWNYSLSEHAEHRPVQRQFFVLTLSSGLP